MGERIVEERIDEKLLKTAFRCHGKVPGSWAERTRASMHECAETPLRRIWGGKRAIILILVLALAVPAGVYAGFRLLSPSDTALLMSRKELAEAFDKQKTDIVTKTDGDYTVSLLGMVSGKQMDEFVPDSKADVERDYVAFAVQRIDGSPIESYDNPDICLSPLIEGMDPMRWGAAAFDNATEKIIKDGVLYCIAEWDDIQKFGYRKMYIAVMEDTFMPSRELFHFDDETGAISENKKYDKVNLLFEIEVGKEKIDRQAAEEWFDEKEAEDMQGDDERDMDLHVQEVVKDGIAFKIQDGRLIGEDDDDVVFALNFFVKGNGIESVQLWANKGGILQPELISKAEYERISAEWEKQKKVTGERERLRSSQGLYLFSDYGKAAKSIKVDYKRLSKNLYGEEALELITTREALESTELKIIVTKKDGSTVTEEVRCSGNRKSGGMEYILYKLQ